MSYLPPSQNSNTLKSTFLGSIFPTLFLIASKSFSDAEVLSPNFIDEVDKSASAKANISNSLEFDDSDLSDYDNDQQMNASNIVDQEMKQPYVNNNVPGKAKNRTIHWKERGNRGVHNTPVTFFLDSLDVSTTKNTNHEGLNKLHKNSDNAIESRRGIIPPFVKTVNLVFDRTDIDYS